MDALDELPDWAQRALESNVAVVISDGGSRAGAYGLYHGGTTARTDIADRIVIYRDTLRRDFGHDPDELRACVVRTVRHELAHHLGCDERARDLGLWSAVKGSAKPVLLQEAGDAFGCVSRL